MPFSSSSVASRVAYSRPPDDRVATFDNDGTLWCEQPIYVQFAFMLDQVKAAVPKHPDLLLEDNR